MQAFKTMGEAMKACPEDPVSHMIRAALYLELRGEVSIHKG